ncbi:cyclin-dependent kinase inhibitor 2A [Cololabis saira]|uniref:cyclin-dependent kinase inhibitor 2A n=1 Tax=Cololabis saira TaxID=129043 RepID=UPI002AD4DED0|nr:cyclin-dependent kinase inhibitor 2A [Cololabis saira]
MSLADQLTTAAARGDTEDVEALLRRGAPVDGENCFGRTALQVMMMGSSAVARLLLDHGADPGVRDRSTGSTPLHDAAREGFVETVRLLVQAGAEHRARDNKHCTPADLAREEGHADVVAFLDTLEN